MTNKLAPSHNKVDNKPKALHTPGPYHHSSLKVRDRHSQIIADCNFRGLDEAIANARLIAAAPDLLEACETVLEVLVGDVQIRDNQIRIRYTEGVDAVKEYYWLLFKLGQAIAHAKGGK